MATPKFSFKPQFKNEKSNVIIGSTLTPESKQEFAVQGFNLKFIKRDKIVLNEKNTFLQVDIQKLADSILNLGLIHNLEAMYDEDRDVYIIESGERRVRALDFLIAQHKEMESDAAGATDEYNKLYIKNVAAFEAGYPVNVKRKNEEDSRLDEINGELRIIAANQEVRPDDPKIRLQNIARYQELLKEKNSLLKKDEKININEEIATLENISERQVYNYKKILTLLPELQEEFIKNNITLSETVSYASLNEQEQALLLEVIQAGKKASAEEIKELAHSLNVAKKNLEEKEKERLNLSEEKKNLYIENKNLTRRLEELQKSNIQEKTEDIKILGIMIIEEKIKSTENTLSDLVRVFEDMPDAEEISAYKKQVKELINKYRNLF